MKKFIIKNEWISLAQLDEILQSDTEVLLDASVKAEIERCRNYLDEKVKDHDQLIYGVNTGFGSLCNTPISSGELGQLQRNLVVSHACGLPITSLQRISKPGLRKYTNSTELPRVINGLGIAIISTSKGIITDKEARNLKVGGEVLCYVY